MAVLLTSWGRTGVPFFAAELALALKKHGCRVEILGDWTDLGDNADDPAEIAVVEDLFQRLGQFLPARRVGNGTHPLSEQAKRDIDAQIFENLVRRERSESGARAAMADNTASARSWKHASRIAAHLRDHRYGAILVPGGLWSLSGLYAVAAAETKTPFWTYDSGQGFLTFARDGAAAHFPDFGEAFRQALEDLEKNPLLADWIESEASRLLDVRRKGNDLFQLQPRDAVGVDAFDVLVPLNYRVDTAAMGRQRAFRDVTSWLDAVVSWAVSRPDVRLVVRQHPCERLENFRSKEDYSRIANAAPGRIRLYSCEDAVNTYDLIEKCRVVLPYTSRTGIEAALLGKPVILGTRCYYGECPFVESAETASAYFQKIASALDGRMPPPPKRAAALGYYLAEVCAMDKTPFTPIYADTKRWLQEDPAAFWEDPGRRRLLAVLENRGNFFRSRFLQSLPEKLAPVS